MIKPHVTITKPELDCLLQSLRLEHELWFYVNQKTENEELQSDLANDYMALFGTIDFLENQRLTLSNTDLFTYSLCSLKIELFILQALEHSSQKGGKQTKQIELLIKKIKSAFVQGYSVSIYKLVHSECSKPYFSCSYSDKPCDRVHFTCGFPVHSFKYTFD